MRRRLFQSSVSRLRRLVAAIGAPTSPLEWYRWIILAVVLINAVLLAPVLLSEAAVPVHLRAGAAVVLVLLSGLWIRQYRQQRAQLAAIGADAAGLWLVSLAVGDPLAALGLLYPVVYFRALYATPRQIALGAVAYLCAHYAAAAVAFEPTIALSMSQVLIQVSGIPMGAAVLLMTARTLRKQERTAARDHLLHGVGLALAAATSGAEVLHLVRDALRDLEASCDLPAQLVLTKHPVGQADLPPGRGCALLRVPIEPTGEEPVWLCGVVDPSLRLELLQALRSLSILSRLAMERLNQIEQVRSSEARFRSLVLNAPDLISVLDANGVILDETPAVNSTLGYAHEARIGRSAMEFIHPDDLPLAAERLARLLSMPNAADMLELRARHRDGHWLWMWVHARNELDNPAVRGLVVNYRDITAQRASAAELLHQARHDALTGLSNRKYLMEQLDQAIAGCSSADTSLALLLLDLDGFKEINDTLGHPAGDALLREIGPRLSALLQPGDTLARLGGDEFAIVLPGAGVSRARSVARHAITSLQQPFDVTDARLELSASVGVALFPEHGLDAETLLRQSDVAMYASKRERTGVAVYDSAADEHTRERLLLAADLREALAAGGLVLHYQPKISLASGEVVGAEALVRWQHAERGLIPPDMFLSLARRNGLMQQLTNVVFDAAVRQHLLWRTAGVDLKVAVNFSTNDVQDPELINRIQRILFKHQCAASGLILEITEDSLIRETGPAADNISKLREMGFEVSIDDFGIGYSSLARLSQLPVDELKIDRAFIRRMAEPREQAVVRSIVDLGRNLRLRVVAEGVEDLATRDALAALGCDEAQGYVFGKPVPAADFMSTNQQLAA